jgi:hypothetical protein
MKKAAEVKYPHSASLFQFCRRVLDHKFGGIRVIDQDVGQILGFDPADCSHWKKGKKNIRSIQAMRSIAEHLGVDERLVVDVAAGDLEDTEAFYEYSGYGAFHLDNKVLEAAKKDFYRRNAALWSKDKESEFKDAFNVNEAGIERVVAEIHERVNFLEAPLYLPEVANAYPDVQLRPLPEAAMSAEAKAQGPVSVTCNGNQTVISYAAGTEMRPYVRYRIAKAMARHFLPAAGIHPMLPGDPAFAETSEFAQHLIDVQGNLFAAKLLAPAALIRREMAQVNVSKDIVAQLAEVVWVSKSFMNRRLKEILQQA